MVEEHGVRVRVRVRARVRARARARVRVRASVHELVEEHGVEVGRHRQAGRAHERVKGAQRAWVGG